MVFKMVKFWCWFKFFEENGIQMQHYTYAQNASVVYVCVLVWYNLDLNAFNFQP